MHHFEKVLRITQFFRWKINFHRQIAYYLFLLSIIVTSEFVCALENISSSAQFKIGEIANNKKIKKSDVGVGFGIIPIRRINNKFEPFLGHPFIKKCMGKDDLPEVHFPEIKFDEDSVAKSITYNIEFNGIDIAPKIIINKMAIDLEPTSQKEGYFITLTQPIEKRNMTMTFVFKSKNGEYITHELVIKDKLASFMEHLSDEQLQRLCIKDQLWIGYGVNNFSFSGYSNELDADYSFGSSMNMPYIDVEYKKFINATLGLSARYKSLNFKIKNSSQYNLDRDNNSIQNLEINTLLRKSNWTISSQWGLFYPYLVLGYSNDSTPIVYLNSAGYVRTSTAGFHQFNYGIGLNWFLNSGYFFDLNLKNKLNLAKSSQITKYIPGLESSLSLSKVFGKSVSLGMDLVQNSQKIEYSFETDSLQNSGTMKIDYLTAYFKIGWVF